MAKKQMIYTDTYKGECRRNNNYMPPLTGDLRSWLPIFGPIITVIGLIFAFALFTSTTKATAVLAKENFVKIDELRIDSAVLKTNYLVIDKRLSNIEAAQIVVQNDLKQLLIEMKKYKLIGREHDYL